MWYLSRERDSLPWLGDENLPELPWLGFQVGALEEETVSITDLEELCDIPDTLPYCPVRLAELMGFSPIAPVEINPADCMPSPRLWRYRVCGLEQVIRNGG